MLVLAATRLRRSGPEWFANVPTRCLSLCGPRQRQSQLFEPRAESMQYAESEGNRMSLPVVCADYRERDGALDLESSKQEQASHDRRRNNCLSLFFNAPTSTNLSTVPLTVDHHVYDPPKHHKAQR